MTHSFHIASLLDLRRARRGLAARAYAHRPIGGDRKELLPITG